jgi:hypothetical protein
MRRLILTGSPSTALLDLDYADAVVDFSIQRFVWGALPSQEQLAAYLAPRSDQHGPGDHWLDFGRWRNRTAALKGLGLIECCRQFETVELWFDPRPNDQLQMAWLLDFFRSYPDIIHRLRLRLVHYELIVILPEKFDESKIPLSDVTNAELHTANMVWQAYRATTPEACVDLLRQDLSVLPLLKPVLLDLLAELPSVTTGLGATEMRFLEMISWGYANANPLFHLRDLRGTRIFNEWEHGYLLDGLALGPTPAVAGLDDELRTLSRDNLGGRHAAYLRSRLSLTGFGKKVVAHKEDFSRHNPIDRWWGGTRLTNDRLWRLNLGLVKP